jgi:hypothetical protein
VKQTREHYTGKEEVAILRRSIRKRCRRFPGQGPIIIAEKERIEFLEKEIRRKDAVLAELMSKHIALTTG